MSLAKCVILIQMQPLNERCHLEIASVMVDWTEMTSSFHFFVVCRTCVGVYAAALHPHMDGSTAAQLCEPRVFGLI